MAGKNDFLLAGRKEDRIAFGLSQADGNFRKFIDSLKTTAGGLREAGGADEASLVASMAATVEGLRFELSLGENRQPTAKEADAVVQESPSPGISILLDDQTPEQFFGEAAWQEAQEEVEGLFRLPDPFLSVSGNGVEAGGMGQSPTLQSDEEGVSPGSRQFDFVLADSV